MAFCPMCGTSIRKVALGEGCVQCGHVLLAEVLDAAATIQSVKASPPAERKQRDSPLLVLRGLRVDRPDGMPLLAGADLELRAGEVICILGPSGAGKTTLGRVFLEPEALRRSGFAISADEIKVRGSLGLVPQRGALFDYLDVAGNIRLALRYSEHSALVTDDDVIDWLQRVDLDEELSRRGVSVSHLSGGQAQRVAVARTLAGGRKVLFLDEPSVGLDSARARLLARQLRKQVETHRAGAIVITHDLSFAVGVADRLVFLDAATRKLVPVFGNDWPGAFENNAAKQPPGARALWQARLEEDLVSRLEAVDDRAPRHSDQRSQPRVLKQLLHETMQPFAVAGSVILDGTRHLLSRPRDVFVIFSRVLRQALLRPMTFYAVVSILLGYTVLYVISGVAPAGVRPEKAVALLGSSHIVALVPPVGAFLFVAASGNAVNGWLGGMSLTKQIAALEALGIDRRRYLWGPCLVGLVLSAIAVSAVLAVGMIVGGAWFCSSHGIADGWDLLTTDFGDPRPDRVPYLVRASLLVVLYGAGIACDVVASGTSDKEESDQVTRSMTGSVVRCTLWVVTLELISTMLLVAIHGR